MINQTPSITPKQEAWREDPDMQLAPIALLRAAKKAKLLAEQTGTPYVIRERCETVDATQISAERKELADDANHTG